MKSTTTLGNMKELQRSAWIDLSALAVIYFAPAFAHLLSFPVYMLEPMRLMLILSVAHTTKKNSYLLALTLPFFSFLVSTHPEFQKMLIITVELVCNVFLFYLIWNKSRNAFLAMVSSIIGSKIICYLLYWVVFSWAFVRDEAGVVFLLVQLLTTLIFSGYIFMIYRKKVE